MPSATGTLLNDSAFDLRQWLIDEVALTFKQQLEAHPGASIGPARILRDPYSARPYVLFYVTAKAILPLASEARNG